MKRILSIVLVVIFVSAIMATAAPRQSAEFLWTTLGGDPRDNRGVWSWDEYGRHSLSPAGQNDWNRVMMPGPVRQVLFSAIQARAWKGVTRIGNYTVTLRDIFVPKGTKYHFITYGAGGYVIRSVQVGFNNGAAYRAIVRCPDGLEYVYDTFKRCSNGAVLSVFTQKSAPISQVRPAESSPAPAPVRKRRFEYGALDMPYQPLGFARRTVTSPGIIGPLSHVLGEWLGRPVSNINFSTGAVYGSTSNSNGGSISTVSGPITATAGGGNSSSNATGGQGGSATGGNSSSNATGGQGGSATGGSSCATGGTSINSNVNDNVNNSNATNTNTNDVTANGGQGGQGGSSCATTGPITNTNNNDATSGSQSGVTNVTGVNTGDGSVQINPIGTDLQQGSGTDQTNH